MRIIVGFLAALLLTGSAHAQRNTPTFDPSAHKGPQTGTPNQVLVLGTPHLSGLLATFRPETLRVLLDRLAAWQPEAVAIEALSGVQCDTLRRYPHRYADTVQDYCWDPAPAQAATGLDVPAATAEAEKLLAAWPVAPTAAQRRHLAAIFLAGGEQTSALVQWLRLSEHERIAGNGLDATLVTRLETLRVRRNEDGLIAAPLAARLGHERVYAMDDHSADTDVPDAKAYGAALMKAWDNPATAQRRAASDAMEKNLETPQEVLALYRAYNAPGQGKLAFDSDFGAALEEPSPQRFGRRYLGYWETRNLRMVGNIREMLQLRPGIRALVIVGASHKPYIDAYLNQMHDVHVQDMEKVLR